MSNQEKQFRTTLMSGLRWSAIKRFGQAFMSIIVTVIMARLLTPSDFGLVAMATVFTGISNIFTELGTGDALIRSKNTSREFASTIFWFNTSLSLVVCLILALIAPFISNLYGEEIVEILIYVLSIEILLSGINRVSHAMLEKNMMFKEIAFAQIISQSAGSLIGISMAFMGYGLWSLVFLGISTQLIYTILVNFSLKWVPLFSFNIKDIKNILSFSSYLTVIKILDHIQRRSEIFIVSYSLGTYFGGIYSQSHALIKKPMKLISGFISPVLFASLSTIQDDFARIKSIYLRSIQSFVMIYLPISILLILYSESFILFVLGEKWSEVIDLMSIFGPMLIFTSMHKCNTVSLKSIGKVNILFKIYSVFVPCSIIACVIGVQFGIKGVAIGMFITTFVLFISSTKSTLVELNIKLNEFLNQIKDIFFYGFLMLASAYLVNILLSSQLETSNIIFGITGSLLSSMVYITMIIKRPVPAYFTILNFIKLKKSPDS
jgi:O-antigen/teichoic acid export membrane protein